MKIKEAIEKGLLKVETIDGKLWVVESNGQKIIGYEKDVEDDEVSIGLDGVVSGVLL